MAMLVWVMVGLAIWHFTVFLPDNFYGGIVGAFCGALLGSVIFGLIVNLGSIPGQHDTDLLTGVEAIPGALIGLGRDLVARRAPERGPSAAGAQRTGAVVAGLTAHTAQSVAGAGQRRAQVALGRPEGRRGLEVAAHDAARGRRRRSPASRGSPRARGGAPANVQTKRPPGRSTRATSANALDAAVGAIRRTRRDAAAEQQRRRRS